MQLKKSTTLLLQSFLALNCITNVYGGPTLDVEDPAGRNKAHPSDAILPIAENGTKGRRLANVSCTLLIKVTEYEDYETTTLECLPTAPFEGEETARAMPLPFKNVPGWLSDKLDNDEIHSNSDMLVMSEAILTAEGLSIPDGAQASHVPTTDEDARERRRHLQVTGTKSVLAMRVLANNLNAPLFTRKELQDEIFGTEGDVYNLKSGYSACSYDKLQFEPTTGTNIFNGVMNVDIGTVNNDSSNVWSAALSKNGWSFGSQPPHDYIMVCQPDNTKSGGSTSWVAYAYIDHWLSVYRGMWCTYPSAQMHELGHNLNLAHSGEGNNVYDDQSCMMGYSYGSDEGPIMCFNGPKNWQLGWFSDRQVSLNSGSSWSGKLYGISDYQSSSSNDAVVIKISSSPNTYVSFNRQAGISLGTQEAGDKVLVHQKSAGPSNYGESYLVAKLDPGQSTTVNGNKISYKSFSGVYANVQIGDPVPEDDCQNTVGWKFTLKNGKKKGCKWFGNKNTWKRCKNKVGALENCPESCNVCDKTGVQVCEKRNLKQSVCNSVSCCEWNGTSCKSAVGSGKCFS